VVFEIRSVNAHLIGFALSAPVTWLTRRLELRRFEKHLSDQLELLFEGFAPIDLAYVKRIADYRHLIGFLFEREETTEEKAVLAATVMMSIAIDHMPAAQRERGLAALLTDASLDPLATRIVRMLETAELIAPETHFQMLGYEIVGKLRGMDRSAIGSWRADGTSNAMQAQRLAASARPGARA
jgi:hypothetical protein